MSERKKSYIEELKRLSDEAFEKEDYKALKEIRGLILDYNKTHSSPHPRIEEQLKELTDEQLRDFQRKVMTEEQGYDIWFALIIQDELDSRKKAIV